MTMAQVNLPPIIAAFGEWGETNIGDHAIHEGVQVFFGECGWRVRSFNLGALSSVDGTRSDDSVPGAVHARRWKALAAVPTAKRALRGLRQRFLIRRLLPELARCDAISVGGGALLSDINLHFPQSLAALTWAARQLQKPLLCLGCSVEEEWSPSGRRMVLDFLSSCSVIAVRDHASAARVSRLLGRDVPVFGDFALRVRSASELHRNASPRYALAVNVTHVPAPHTASQRRYEEGLIEVVGKVAEQNPGTRIAIFTTGTAQDVAPATRVWRRLESGGAELHVGRSLEQLRDVMHSSRAVVAARLHAAIISLTEQVPVIGYAATPKVGNFFETVGLRASYFGPNDPASVVAEQLMRIMSPPQPSAPACASFDAARQGAREFLFSLTESAHRRGAVSP